MRTYVAEINGVALIAFRARGDNEVYDKNGNLQLGLNGFSGVVRPDGGPLWDGDPHLGDRDQLAAGPNPFGRDSRQTVIHQLSDQGGVEAVRAQQRLRHAIAPHSPEHGESAPLLRSQAHRRVPGKLLPRSIQFGIALAPRLPHRVHRMCRVNDGTGTSSGQASTLTLVLLPQARQVAKSERTPRLRMLPSVIDSIGSSERGIVEHSIPGRDVWEPARLNERTCDRSQEAPTGFSIIGLSRLPAWPDLSGWPDAG